MGVFGKNSILRAFLEVPQVRVVGSRAGPATLKATDRVDNSVDYEGTGKRGNAAVPTERTAYILEIQHEPIVVIGEA